MLLQDQASLQDYNKALENLRDSALTASQGALPVFTIGKISDSQQKYRFEFWVKTEDNQTVIRNKITAILEKCKFSKKFDLVDFSKNVRAVNGKYLDYTSFFITMKSDDLSPSQLIELLYSSIIKLTLEISLKAIWLGDLEPIGVSNILNPEFNRYYTNDYSKAKIPGFTKTLPWSPPLNRGGKPYYCPNGWMRLSLNVASSSEEFDKKWGNWHVGYHGTRSTNFTVSLFLASGQLQDVSVRTHL